MRHDEQVRLIKQLLSHLDEGTNVDAGVLTEQATTTYTDPRQARQERELFFRSTPQCVGMSQDLAEPGAFLTSNDFGVPLLATRSEAGDFQAFINSCRHRGAVVETEPRGVRRRFTCPFHAWSYDPGGTLVGLPKRDQFGEVQDGRACASPLSLDLRHQVGFARTEDTYDD